MTSSTGEAEETAEAPVFAVMAADVIGKFQTFH